MRYPSRQQNATVRDAVGSSPSLRRALCAALLTAGWLIGSQPAFAQDSGQQIFQKACAACHSIGGGKLVGPDLAGVNDRRPADWLVKFIKSSQALVNAGDQTAKALFDEYKMPMPDQALSDDQIRKVLAHIQEAGGGASAAKSAAPPAQAAPTAAPNPDEIQRGQDLFEGKLRFANGGPSCNACHHVTNDALLGGGILASELTLVFSRLGKQGVTAILGGNPFPAMQAAYAGKAFSAEETNALVAFLQHADQERTRQLPKEWGWRMFSAGLGGIVVLLGIFSLAGRRRKKRSVNQDIYDRQLRSE